MVFLFGLFLLFYAWGSDNSIYDHEQSLFVGPSSLMDLEDSLIPVDLNDPMINIIEREARKRMQILDAEEDNIYFLRKNFFIFLFDSNDVYDLLGKNHVVEFDVVEKIRSWYVTESMLRFLLEKKGEPSYMPLFCQKIAMFSEKKMFCVDLYRKLLSSLNSFSFFSEVVFDIIANKTRLYCSDDFNDTALIARVYNKTIFQYACEAENLSSSIKYLFQKCVNYVVESRTSISSHYYMLFQQRESYRRNLFLFDLYCKIERAYFQMMQFDLMLKITSISVSDAVNTRAEPYVSHIKVPGKKLKELKEAEREKKKIELSSLVPVTLAEFDETLHDSSDDEEELGSMVFGNP